MDPGSGVVEIVLEGLMDKGIVEKKGTQYRLRGLDATG
jgi:hypothetical protein